MHRARPCRGRDEGRLHGSLSRLGLNDLAAAFRGGQIVQPPGSSTRTPTAPTAATPKGKKRSSLTTPRFAVYMDGEGSGPTDLSSDHSLAELARQAMGAGADRLGVAAGDGSLAAVAAIARVYRL